MPSNIEIKARVPDLDLLRRRVDAVCDSREPEVRQVDTFFGTERGRLKLREISTGPSQLIFYVRPDTRGPELSEYVLCPVSDPDAVKQILSALLGQRGVVAKSRSVAHLGNIRIHLDVVQGLGAFLELEAVLGPSASRRAEKERVEALMGRLGIRKEDLLERAYVDLLQRPE